MKIVGLTGSIGMGKSTTAQMFRERGMPVFDADEAVRRLQAPGGVALPAIEAAFPGVVQNNQLDRAALRDQVFDQPERRKTLENIIHPLVGALRADFLYEAEREQAPMAVLDVPLLFETRMNENCDIVVVVSAPEDVQRARVLARDGMTEEAFKKILLTQMSDREKRRRADYVIETGHGFEAAGEAVDAFIRAIVYPESVPPTDEDLF